MLRDKRAQAATELAVLGSLVIVAFSFLMMYSEKLNREQANIMKAFRTALANAGGGGSASYSRITHRRMVNIVSPMTLGQMGTFSASGSVLWGVGGSESSLIGIDGKEISAPKDEDGDGIIDSEEGNKVYDSTNKTWSKSSFSRDQTPGSAISTTRGLEATDISYDGQYGVTTKLGDGGVYSSGGGGINRSHTWSTPEN